MGKGIHTILKSLGPYSSAAKTSAPPCSKLFLICVSSLTFSTALLLGGVVIVLLRFGFPSWSKELSLVDVPDFRAFEDTEERRDFDDFGWDGAGAPDVAEKKENGLLFWNSVRRLSNLDIVAAAKAVGWRFGLKIG